MSDSPESDKPSPTPPRKDPRPRFPPPKGEGKPDTSPFDFDSIDDVELPKSVHTPTPPAMRKPNVSTPTPGFGPTGATAPGAQRASTPTPPGQRRIPSTGAPTPRFDWGALGVDGKPRPAGPVKGGVGRDDSIPVVDVDDASPSPTVALNKSQLNPPPGAPRAPGGPPTPPPRPPSAARPAALRAPTPVPGAPVRGTPTPPPQRIPSSPETVTPGDLPKPDNTPLEIEDDATTNKRIGITPPKGSPPARTAASPGHPAPERPLQIAGETKKVERPAATPGPATPPAPVRPGNPNINFDRILIIRLSALGDCVHVLPAFANLRKAFPHAKIAWAIEDRFASLLDGLPGLDQVLVFPRREFRGIWWKPWLWPSSVLRAMKTAKAIRAFAPTVAFDFQGNLKSAMHMKVCKAPAKIGLDEAKEGAEKHYNYRVKIDGVVHRVERGLQLLRAADVPVSVARVSPAIAERDRAAIDAWIREKNARHTVVCHIGTSAFGAIKRWPVEKWARVGALLSREGQRTVLFAWGPGEREIAEAAARGAASDRVFAGPDTPRIGALAALVARASVVIGCDSGPLHLAAMMNAPVVGLYGPKDPAVYGPWCDRHVVVWKGMPCSPCTKRDCDITDCMNLIEPEEVAQAAEGLLTRIKSPAALAGQAGGAGKTLWASGEGWEVGKEEVQ